MRNYTITLQGKEINITQNDDGTFNKPDFILELEKQGTATKPAHEPICMARKPLAEKSVSENVLKYGTGGINIDESRVGTEDTRQKTGGAIEGSGWGTKGGAIAGSELGRFPANLILSADEDGQVSEEVRECFPETTVRTRKARTAVKGGCSGALGHFGGSSPDAIGTWPEDNGGNASRFFKSIIYQAKASKAERNKGCEGLEEKDKDTKILPNRKCLKCHEWENKGAGNGVDYCKCEEPDFEDKTIRKFTNNHPTVKPIALMEYLIKMVTPRGGIVLDPFAGSGSTLVAAKQNGFRYIGIEQEPEYVKIAEARLKAVQDTLL